MKRSFALALLALLAGCDSRVPGRVDARDHDAFWLWAGVQPQPVLKQAKTLYILDGEARGSPVRYVPLRPQTPRVEGPEVWMVVRTDNLHWSEATHRMVLGRMAQWAKGNRLAGLQIDFDARTQGLATYAAFLRQVRRKLPTRYELSVTGLLDWSANGDPAGLEALGGTVDDIVLQTYQGRETIQGYEAYVAKLDRMRQPFRIGLVQGGRWHEPEGLRANRNFRGYVVFLLND